MKTTTPLLCLFLTCVSLPADVLTIDNNPGTVAMYDNLTDAYDAAMDNDTLLFAPSATAYGSVTSYKPLTFLGPGYLPDVNGVPGLNNNVADVDIAFNQLAGTGDSSGSTARGISGQISVGSGVINITIDKCWNGNHTWTISDVATISRCYFTSTGATLSLNTSNSSVTNCIVSNLALNIENTTATHCIITRSIGSVPSSSVSNTIFNFSGAGFFDDDGSFSFCMSIGGNYLPSGGNNINGQILADVFVPSGTFDGQYQLKSGSTAEGTGSSGANMGIFGAATPYGLSLIPGNTAADAVPRSGDGNGYLRIVVRCGGRGFPGVGGIVPRFFSAS